VPVLLLLLLLLVQLLLPQARAWGLALVWC
jgi:hypothetical protein